MHLQNAGLRKAAMMWEMSGPGACGREVVMRCGRRGNADWSHVTEAAACGWGS